MEIVPPLPAVTLANENVVELHGEKGVIRWSRTGEPRHIAMLFVMGKAGLDPFISLTRTEEFADEWFDDDGTYHLRRLDPRRVHVVVERVHEAPPSKIFREVLRGR